MKIISAKFATSVANINQIPSTNYPEIAFAGRSNVGKSSLINCLINRKKLALTSSSPGKTRMLNYYEINDKLLFVDLPGYGYAKVPKKERGKWKELIEAYFSRSKNLRGVIQVIDSRIEPTILDMEMIMWLNHIQKQFLIVATKTDKLSKNKMNIYIEKYQKRLASMGISEIIPFSAVTRHGKKEVWQAIHQFIGEFNK